MKLEVRVPISPRPYFFRQVEYLWRSILACGGQTSSARLVVSVGEDIAPYDIAARETWSGAQVTWRWVDREEFRRHSYHATGADRFRFETDAEMVLFADADILFIAGVDDILDALRASPAVAGVIAHLPPFHASPSETWERVFARLGRRVPRDRYQHTGWGGMYSNPTMRFGPAYYNFGAVFVPRAFLPRLAAAYLERLESATRDGADFFRGQLALCLAIHDLDIPRVALETRFNFPNDPSFDARYPADLADVRILHYLRTGIVDRWAIWESPDALAKFLARTDLRGSNEVLRRRMQHLAGRH
jgi:hypothetical protein